MMMELILQKAGSFWTWWRGLSSFEQLLLTVLLVAVLLFVLRRTKINKVIIRRFRRWAIRYQSFRYRTLWEPVALSIATIGIFIYLFGDKLLIEMDQDTLRNLILLTAGVVGWYFLIRRTKAAEKSAETAEKVLASEQITRAIEQLTNKENLFVRLGGILGLEQIAKAHEEERIKIARILVSFIQTHATKGSEKERQNPIAYRMQRFDIEAAVSALAGIASRLEREEQFGKQYNETKYSLCDLRGTDLRGLRFVDTDLSKFDLTGVDMSSTWLRDVNLSKALLYRIILKKEVKFIDAHLERVNFFMARLNRIDFSGACVQNTDFSGARLWGANFTNTVLEEVKFKAAVLNGANLTDADWSNMPDIRQYQIDKAFRSKGHDTVILSDKNQKFKPPPER